MEKLILLVVVLVGGAAILAALVFILAEYVRAVVGVFGWLLFSTGRWFTGDKTAFTDWCEETHDLQHAMGRLQAIVDSIPKQQLKNGQP